MFVRSHCAPALVIAAALGSSVGCETPTGTETVGLESTLARASNHRSGAIASPFLATAVTRSPGVVEDPSCGAPPRLLETQIGVGNGTQLGRFDITFTFCVDATDLFDDGMLTAGESVPYDNVLGIITAANGDRLYLAGSGAVLPSDEPGYDFEFHDTFTFTGGTGRFEGAEGVLVTESYVDQADGRTDHTWRGTLILRRGRGCRVVDPVFAGKHRAADGECERR